MDALALVASVGQGWHGFMVIVCVGGVADIHGRVSASEAEVTRREGTSWCKVIRATMSVVRW